MTLLMERPTTEPRRRRARGWRPRGSGDFPTLGWAILSWTYHVLPSPTNETEPFVYTHEQAQRILRIYELDPETGERLVNRRVHEEEAKGWGKSPFAGSLALAEFRGPVRFGGWDDDGQPIGHRWGHEGTPQPWVQIAAVSETQTRNTFGAITYLVSANRRRAAIELGIEDGRTLLYLKDMPLAMMERVTARAGTKEGQPITHAVLDEPQLWTPANGGDKLARTILRNLTKTDGWAHFTGNAPILGQDSVAETYSEGEPEPGVIHFATRPEEVPREDWEPERKLWALGQVYRDVPWMMKNLKRVLADVEDPKVPWSEKLRFSFNTRDEALGDRWMPPEPWDACAGEVTLAAREPAFACVRIAHRHQWAAVAVAQVVGPGGRAVQLDPARRPVLREGDRVLLRCSVFTAGADDQVDVASIEKHLRELRGLVPARVLAKVPVGNRGRERDGHLRGPEIAYAGAFFAGSAQRFRAERAALVDVPSSLERLAPAAETLMQLVQSGVLLHDGDEDLAEQIGDVVATPATKGWKLEARGPEAPIVAAIAAMLAVHRAMTAPRWRPAPLTRH